MGCVQGKDVLLRMQRTEQEQTLNMACIGDMFERIQNQVESVEKDTRALAMYQIRLTEAVESVSKQGRKRVRSEPVTTPYLVSLRANIILFSHRFEFELLYCLLFKICLFPLSIVHVQRYQLQNKHIIQPLMG